MYPVVSIEPAIWYKIKQLLGILNLMMVSYTVKIFTIKMTTSLIEEFLLCISSDRAMKCLYLCMLLILLVHEQLE